MRNKFNQMENNNEVTYKPIKKKKPFYKKWYFWLIIIVALVIVFSQLSNKIEDNNKKNEKYNWPTNSIASLLPEPKSDYGKIEYDSEDGFSLNVYKISPEEFNSYIDECKNKGFTVDYYGSESYYNADNEDGYSLSVDYNKDEETMNITISEAIEETEAETTKSQKEETTKEEKKDASEKSDEVTPEFKATLDTYEAFFDEYIEFMEEYNNSDDISSMLTEYADFMKKYAEYMEALDELEDEELSDADAAYLIEVQARITEKLAAASY